MCVYRSIGSIALGEYAEEKCRKETQKKRFIVLDFFKEEGYEKEDWVFIIIGFHSCVM